MSNKVYMVMSKGEVGFLIHALFNTKEEAEKLAQKFMDNDFYAEVEEYDVLEKMPKVYTHECHMDMKTGEVIKVNPCRPTLQFAVLVANNETVIAPGDGEDNAKEIAENYKKILGQVDPSTK